MATITKGKTFINGELVTPAALHSMVDAATISDVTNADIAAGAAIVDTKLAPITTAGKVANTATSASSANAANAIVVRDASGNFAAGTITAALSGNAVTATTASACSGNAATATTASACSGNAATATKLATARTINGVAFDGTANITLATGVTSTVAISQGGTGATTAADARTNLGAASSSHTHSAATTSADGFMSSTDKSKLDGIPSGGGGITGTVAITQGGTGSTTAAGALTNLGAAASSHNHDASAITTGTLSNARTTATTALTANSIVQRGASGEISIGNATSQPNSFNYGEFWSTNGTDYSVLGRGNVIIANGGAVGTLLVAFFGGGTTFGSISRSGTNSVAYSTSSDYRLKTNLEPQANAVARLLQIPVHRFNWVADPNGEKVDGFLAHEAAEIVPECVVGTKDEVDAEGKPKYQGIDQSKLVPLLFAAVQELAARVAALEAK